MKKHLLFLFTILLPLLASAEKVEIDGIWYNLVHKAKQAEITFKGDSYDSNYNEYFGSITIPATITYDGVKYRVTSIGEHAFSRCERLTSITIPESVISIGSHAFLSCRSLTAITLPKSAESIEEETFRGCSSLESVTIPLNVTSIGDYAFSDCSNLTSISISEGVTSIGTGAFFNCDSLTNINIPEGVTYIEGHTFYNCSGLTSITLPESVASIGGYAFYQCSGLTTINIPKSVTTIAAHAFSNCSSLQNINIPKGVIYLEDEVFAHCPELTDVYCYAESVPNTNITAFEDSYPEYATLHVPASAINNYKATEPWGSFGTIVTIEDVKIEKCATPTISYKDGKIVFSCATEESRVKSNIKENITGDHNDMEVDFTPIYTITAYATKAQYEDSDVVTLDICWLPCAEEHEENNSILTIPSKPVLIQCGNGVITLIGLAEDTEVAVYTTTGTEVAAVTVTNGTATIATNLEAGTTAIVKIGEYSVKVMIK